jgi:hypothetical protein
MPHGFKVWSFQQGIYYFQMKRFWIEAWLSKYFILEFVISKYWSSWIEVWFWKCYFLLPIYAQFCLFVHAS